MHPKLRPYHPDDRAQVTQMNLTHYQEVEGFDHSFENAIENALNKIHAQLAEARCKFLVVAEKKRVSGCIFFSQDGHNTGRIRLFYLSPELRGRGLGHHIVSTVLDHASTTGFERVSVSTFDRHLEACRLYAAFGFKSKTGPIRRYFGQDMRQIDFDLAL